MPTEVTPLVVVKPKPAHWRRGVGVSLTPEIDDKILEWAAAMTKDKMRFGMVRASRGDVIFEMVRTLSLSGWRPGQTITVNRKKK